ncbi:hypothetical protein BC826DRAFT_575295 [Russula brevipes]|nr:hypothetical protein BC826DRAFT_575295 [Russula brevipes]
MSSCYVANHLHRARVRKTRHGSGEAYDPELNILFCAWIYNHLLQPLIWCFSRARRQRRRVIWEGLNQGQSMRQPGEGRKGGTGLRVCILISACCPSFPASLQLFPPTRHHSPHLPFLPSHPHGMSRWSIRCRGKKRRRRRLRLRLRLVQRQRPRAWAGPGHARTSPTARNRAQSVMGHIYHKTPRTTPTTAARGQVR